VKQSATTLPAEVAALLDAQADRYGISRIFPRAVAWIESRGLQSARGTSGEIGVMQLMPATAKGLGVDATDLHQNIEGGVRLLAQLQKRFGEEGALAAYNGGPRFGSKTRVELPAQIRRYVDLVMARAEIEANTMGARTAAGPFGQAEPTPAQRRSRSPSAARPSPPPLPSSAKKPPGEKGSQ
jgi:soluble lytic murein transglycosylase-like protein